MHFIKDEGFIIRRRNFGDADRMVTIFSRQNGKISLVAKGVRKITSRRGAFLEPLNLINFHAVKSHSKHILTEVELVSSFPENRGNISNYQKIFLVCELIESLCGENEPIATLYKRLLEFLYDDKRYSSFLQFKTDLLVTLGYWNPERRFVSDDESYRYIESIIERKLKSRAFTL